MKNLVLSTNIKYIYMNWIISGKTFPLYKCILFIPIAPVLEGLSPHFFSSQTFGCVPLLLALYLIKHRQPIR